MRLVVLCSFALVITLAAIGRCQDIDGHCPYMEQCRKQGYQCCKEGAACCQDGKLSEAIVAELRTAVQAAKKAACKCTATACEAKGTDCDTKATACNTAACNAAVCNVAKACQAKTAACQAASTACKTSANACQVKTRACKVKAVACETKAACCKSKAAACKIAGIALRSEKATCECGSKCSCKESGTEGTGCSHHDKITHLQKAAKHLHAAGLTSEAKHVLAKAKALHQELVADKVVELKRLKAEVARLRHAVAQHQKVLVSSQETNGEHRVRVIVVAVPDAADGAKTIEEIVEEIVDAPQTGHPPTAQAPAATRK